MHHRPHLSKGSPGLEPRIPGDWNYKQRPEPTKRSAKSNCSHWQNAYNCRSRSAGQCISGSSKASLPIRRDSTRYRTPNSQTKAQIQRNCHDSATTDYLYRKKCTLSNSVQHLSSHFHGGDVTHIVDYPPSSSAPDNTESISHPSLSNQSPLSSKPSAIRNLNLNLLATPTKYVNQQQGRSNSEKSV